jgi:nucleoid-associated protein YgaU
MPSFSSYTSSYAESPRSRFAMLLTDLNGPMSLQPRSPGLGRISRPTRFAAPAILFLSFASFGAAVSQAQDQQDQSVAEAARQERARKQELQKRAKHVYTEEDLKHPDILTPEHRAQIEAKRNECAQKNNCSPAQNPASLDANSETPQIPLGDVARQLRKQKELQALKPKQSEPFHLPFSTPALASPILPERPAIRPPARPVLRPKTPSNVFRRDPFAAVPVRPRVPANARASNHAGVRENMRPTIRPHVDLLAPAQPKMFFRPSPPSILIQPMQPPVPAKPVQPAAPLATVRPLQPRSEANSAAIATQKTVSAHRGDSLWKLAKQNLGRGSRWPELVAVNPGISDPNKISIGTEINLPAAATAAAPRQATNTGATTIKVQKGDTLWTLAKSNLSRASAWPCLAAANPSITNPDHIYEGQELTVPITCKP